MPYLVGVSFADAPSNLDEVTKWYLLYYTFDQALKQCHEFAHTFATNDRYKVTASNVVSDTYEVYTIDTVGYKRRTDAPYARIWIKQMTTSAN